MNIVEQNDGEPKGQGQELPPALTTAPQSPFHDNFAIALYSLSLVGRGFGDPRTNAMVPQIVHRVEVENADLRAAAAHLTSELDRRNERIAELREQLAVVKGELEVQRGHERQLLAEQKSTSRITKLCLTAMAAIFPMGLGVYASNPYIGLSLLLLSLVAGVIGFRPQILHFLEKAAAQ